MVCFLVVYIAIFLNFHFVSSRLTWVATCIAEAQLQFPSSHRFEASISLSKDFESLYSHGYINFPNSIIGSASATFLTLSLS